MLNIDNYDFYLVQTYKYTLNNMTFIELFLANGI